MRDFYFLANGELFSVLMDEMSNVVIAPGSEGGGVVCRILWEHCG
jgi:hypothetical protein